MVRGRSVDQIDFIKDAAPLNCHGMYSHLSSYAAKEREQGLLNTKTLFHLLKNLNVVVYLVGQDHSRQN